ncbi:MAG: hypothetical protein PUC38_08055 [Bacteroidales bacterium]|nr:hypothetical protein [Bacteroidales bacterium]
MTKKLFLAVLLCMTALTMSAQRTKHALGVHIGGATVDVEYQYHLSDKNFLDVTAGIFDFGDGFAAQGIYNWNVKQWGDWTPKFATWKLWAGVGAGIGAYHDFMFGPVGTVGFGFTPKKLPLTVGVDYRPMVAFVLGDEFDVLSTGFYNFGLTVTYRF